MRIVGLPAVSGHFLPSETARIALGPAGLDQALAGGLSPRRLHEIVPETIFQLGAAAGFALGLTTVSRRAGAIVWIQQGLAAAEGGVPYSLGAALFDIAPSRFLLVRTATAKDALWAM